MAMEQSEGLHYVMHDCFSGAGFTHRFLMGQVRTHGSWFMMLVQNRVYHILGKFKLLGRLRWKRTVSLSIQPIPGLKLGILQSWGLSWTLPEESKHTLWQKGS